VSKSSRRINYTQETAEPLGVSPPEAVDLLLIKPYTDYVIGMDRAISDTSAIQFSLGFYEALAFNKNIPFAFEYGLSAIQEKDADDIKIPKMHVSNREKKSDNVIQYISLRKWRERQSNAKRLLVLASNPEDAAALNLGEEVREIYSELQQRIGEGLFAIEQIWAVTFGDFQEALFNFRPHIIHYTGFGSEQGLVFEGTSGRATTVGTSSLVKLVKVFGQGCECFLINADNTISLAELMSRLVGFAIGMSSAITDQAAVAFSTGFYRAISMDLPFDVAFHSGCLEIQQRGMPEDQIPTLFKDGIHVNT